MIVRKLIKIIVGLCLAFALLVGLISIDHPIILKWLSGTARRIGKPVQATVYIDGKVNDQVQVFNVDRYWGSDKNANNYLVHIKGYDSVGSLEYFNINLAEKWIGKPVATSKKDYDFIAGHLFQSETGGHFTSFQDDMKGFNFDPQLSWSEKQINFKLPPGKMKFDSVRIELQ